MTKFLISLTGDKKQTKKAGAGGGGYTRSYTKLQRNKWEHHIENSRLYTLTHTYINLSCPEVAFTFLYLTNT